VHRNNSTGSTPVILKSTEPSLVEQTDVREEPADRIYSGQTEISVGSMAALMKRKNHTQSDAEMSSLTFSFPYNPSLNAGSRAFEAFVRPSPILVAGTPKSYGFDMRSCRFSLTMVPYTCEPPEDAPTEIFVPEYLFQDCEPEIWVSSGQWIMYRPGQVLRWWHAGSAEQTLKISSGYKRDGFVGIADNDVEGWYYWNGKCKIM
jgi:Glycoside hydrolase family 5 C-terminal domain